jgi:hypothetical protein
MAVKSAYQGQALLLVDCEVKPGHTSRLKALAHIVRSGPEILADNAGYAVLFEPERISCFSPNRSAATRIISERVLLWVEKYWDATNDSFLICSIGDA